MADPVATLREALVDRYAFERELGRGGMATVYLAHDLRHDRPVALKVLHPDLAATLGPDRFLREIKLCARLQHPHILTVHDSGESAGQLWFTMPFIEGESLRDRLRRQKQLPVEDALRIAREAADALDYAHRHQVIHRDVKPENILLTEGHALVADFGDRQDVEQRADGTDERLGGGEADRDRPGRRHSGVHEPGAGCRRAGAERGDRRLLARCRALRDAGRRAPLHWTHGPGGRRPAAHRAGAERSTDPPQRARDGGPGDSAGAGAGRRRPICLRRGLR